ncbi:MAG: sel1 repeat family protein [Magnetospirillum sp.]|nr:sel1 repeat family protein [Magnetospirillum sp.]
MLLSLMAVFALAGAAEASCDGRDDARIAAVTSAGDREYFLGLDALRCREWGAARRHLDRALDMAEGEFVLWWLSDLFAEGAEGVPADEDKAVRVLRRGADLGLGLPTVLLGMRTLEGRGVRQDVEVAADLFRRGVLAFRGIDGWAFPADALAEIIRPSLPVEITKQYEWVDALVADPPAALSISESYLARHPPDGATACRILYLAAGAGNAEASFRLGRMMLAGTLVAKQPEHGVKYLLAAASRGHPNANAEIGMRLVGGEIAPPVPWAGLAWLLHAKALGASVDRQIDAARQGLSARDLWIAHTLSDVVPSIEVPSSAVGLRCVAP